jgi:hypothetical protein
MSFAFQYAKIILISITLNPIIRVFPAKIELNIAYSVTKQHLSALNASKTITFSPRRAFAMQLVLLDIMVTQLAVYASSAAHSAALV